MNHTLCFNPPVIAHRGASGYAPENTFLAFVKAVELGIKWVEFDVMPAACGEPIIFHDDELVRTTGHQGSVVDYPYSYLQTLDAGSWFHSRFSGERIPTLQDMLVYLHEVRMNANIEIKTQPEHEEQLVLRILEVMAPYWKSGQTYLFSSFSISALKLLRQHAPTCLIGLLLDTWRDDWRQVADELQCVSINVNADIMTPDRVQAIKATNRAVLCYTVNSMERAEALFHWGVDAVFSDMPDKIVRR